MGFYTEPAFFIVTAVVVCIAIVIGLLQKPLHKFGLVASIVMLGLLFSESLASLVFFLAYLVYSLALEKYVERLFRMKDSRAVAKYRVALALQIAPLAVYKVGVLFNPTFLGFIGISYITFKAVQVLIELRDGLIESMQPWRYLYFLMFFPTFTSGPILRSRAFEKDLDRTLTRTEYLEYLYRGAGWFILGALYKFVGSALTGWLMWFAPAAIGGDTPGAFACAQLAYAFMYGLNLFFDFAGYSHMAVGVGFALGIEVPRNFRAPFLSVDIKDFWNRWHITLSYWLRDFVFMRFTTAAFEHSWFKSTVTTACIAYIVNMLVMGFWHGITVDFVAYGLYHGLLLAACELIQRKWGFYKKHKKDRWFRICSWAVTMIAVFYGFALFSGQALHPIAV